MKKYESPTLLVKEFSYDVVATSLLGNDIFDDNENGVNSWV